MSIKFSPKCIHNMCFSEINTVSWASKWFKNVNFFSFFLFVCHFWWAKRKILCGKYISYIFHVFSEARDNILILNITCIFCLATSCVDLNSLRNIRYPAEWTGVNVHVVFRMKLKISKSRLSLLISGIFNTHFKGSNTWSKYTTLIKYTLEMDAY
jgi:hypothetical protein